MEETRSHPGLVEHALIDKVFRSVIVALAAGNTIEIVTEVIELADLIRAHIEVESSDLAEFALVDPVEAQALLDDHERFYEELEALVARAQAATLDPADVFAFKAAFVVHEAREERGFYRSPRMR